MYTEHSKSHIHTANHTNRHRPHNIWIFRKIIIIIDASGVCSLCVLFVFRSVFLFFLIIYLWSHEYDARVYVCVCCCTRLICISKSNLPFYDVLRCIVCVECCIYHKMNFTVCFGCKFYYARTAGHFVHNESVSLTSLHRLSRLADKLRNIEFKWIWWMNLCMQR